MLENSKPTSFINQDVKAKQKPQTKYESYCYTVPSSRVRALRYKIQRGSMPVSICNRHRRIHVPFAKYIVVLRRIVNEYKRGNDNFINLKNRLLYGYSFE